MKHLKNQSIYTYDQPLINILDTFPKPKGIRKVVFRTQEFTSLCPITGQPDMAEVQIAYVPTTLCIETKSLKLYLNNFRMYQGFIEEISGKIAYDIYKTTNAHTLVQIHTKSRGGIELSVTSEQGGPTDDIT